MPTLCGFSDALSQVNRPDESELAKMEQRLPPLLSVIAGMVDLTGFFTLGSIFTAHVTGNLVLAAAAAVHGGPWNLAPAIYRQSDQYGSIADGHAVTSTAFNAGRS